MINSNSHEEYLRLLKAAQESARLRQIHESIYFPKPSPQSDNFSGGRTEEEFENLFLDNDYIDPEYFE